MSPLPTMVLCLLSTLSSGVAAAGQAAAQEAASGKKPQIVFVTGDCEYRSEITMPLVADILEARHNMECTVCYAVDDQTGEREPKHLQNIAGLEALKEADLAVFFLRYRQLPDDQLRLILDYVHSGKPIVGLRTSTHAFRYGGGPNARWDDSFGREVFGQQWIRHHGHDSSTSVYVALQEHPITRGVEPVFHCRSWLYHVVPLAGDCTPLAIGSAVRGDRPSEEIFGIPSPVAWTKSYHGARVFFTTLGHPQDFENQSMRRLLINGIYWALGAQEKIPPGGTDVRIEGEYIAPPTARALPDPGLPAGSQPRYAEAERRTGSFPEFWPIRPRTADINLVRVVVATSAD